MKHLLLTALLFSILHSLVSNFHCHILNTIRRDV